jgi:Uma2 family endonuclease
MMSRVPRSNLGGVKTTGGAAMTKVLPAAEQGPLIIRLRPVIDLTEDQFFEFCQINEYLQIERTAEGDIVIMPPEGGESGHRSISLGTSLTQWAWQDGTGVTFGSSTGFVLPNGAMRAPDAAWVKRSRLATLTPDQKRKFLPLCPDFVVEIRSPTDRLSVTQAKMQEYLDNGAELGWLVDPENRVVYVYRPNQPVAALENPMTLAGDPVLPGFILDLQKIWQADF